MNTLQCRQVVFGGINEVSLTTTTISTDLGKQALLVRTLCSYVSAGTELAKLTGLQAVTHPYVAGNRAIAEVLAVGEDVRDVAVGDRVMTFTPHAEFAVTDGFRVRVPHSVPDEHAAICALGLVAMASLRVAPPQLGDVVVVLGLGAVGLMAAMLFRCAGARVVGVDVSEGRRERARSAGLAYPVGGGRDDTVANVLALAGGHGADIVVEATGNPAVVREALAVARRSGQVVLLGSPRGDHHTDITPLLNHVHLWREHGNVTLRGAHEWQLPEYETPFSRHSIQGNADTLFRLISDDQLDLSSLIGRVVAPTEAPAAYAGLRRSPDDWSGLLFDWR